MFRTFLNLFLFAAVAVLFYLFYRIFSPFLASIFVAVILGLIFYPLYRWLQSRTKGRKRLSSVLACVAVTLIIIVPVSAMIGMLTAQSLDLYRFIEERVQDGSLETMIDLNGDGPIPSILNRGMRFFDLDPKEIVVGLSKVLQNISGFIVSAGSGLVKNISSMIINFFLMIFTLYYLFIDGERLRDELIHLSPLSTRYETRILGHFQQVTAATVKGSLLTAMAQGMAGGLGFVIAGLSAAALWGSVMAFYALIPMVGTAIVWAPAAIYLIATGHWIKGLFLILWGGLLVGLIDNLLKPILIKGETRLHPLLIFFSILGGLKVFGFLGIVIGPTILAIFLTMLEIYKEEFHEELEQQDNEQPEG